MRGWAYEAARPNTRPLDFPLPSPSFIHGGLSTNETPSELCSHGAGRAPCAGSCSILVQPEPPSGSQALSITVTEKESFENTLAKLGLLLKERGASYALIGGLAVAVWGTPRATEDIDLLAELSPSPELDAALRAAGFAVDWRRGDPDDPIPLLLHLSSATGPEIDILCATRSWERDMLDRAMHIRLPNGFEAPVVAVEDLIILKLMAGGPGDLVDAADLLERTGLSPELKKQAAARGVAGLLEQVMASIGVRKKNS